MDVHLRHRVQVFSFSADFSRVARLLCLVVVPIPASHAYRRFMHFYPLCLPKGGSAWLAQELVFENFPLIKNKCIAVRYLPHTVETLPLHVVRNALRGARGRDGTSQIR